MTIQPRVAFGIPTYNHAHQLERTLESILSQSFKDIAVVAVDDCSSDDTPKILERYAGLDPRLRVIHNDKRLGYTLNARKAYQACLDLFPSIDYFAWGSDHDLWHPHWVQLLAKSLDEKPEASLAWCRCLRISDEGEIVRTFARSLDGAMREDRLQRIRFAARGAPAGFLLHGLIRASALAKTSGLRLVLEPDRLLVTELAAMGPFTLVPEYLWHRRYFGLATRGRQRRNSFANSFSLHTYLPITLQHGWVLFQTYVLEKRGVPEIDTKEGWRVAWTYMAQRVAARTVRMLRKALAPIKSRVRHLARAASH